MQRSTVKWFDSKKGFGFIFNPTAGEQDLIVHYSEIEGKGYRSLQEGDRVEFEMERTERGPCARKVRRLH